MFSSELDRSGFPLAARSWGIGLGSIVMIAVAAALVSAKTVPYLYAVTVASFIAAAAVRGQLIRALSQLGTVSLHLAIFLLYACLSAAWAMEPFLAFLHALAALATAAGTMILLQLFAEETRPNLLHMAEGLWVGFGVALLFLFLEIATDQSVKIWIYNTIGMRPGDLRPLDHFHWSGDTLISVSREDLTRNMAPLVLYLWPAVLGMRGTLARSRATIAAVLTVALAGAVVMLAWHETSKLAFLVGLATFGFAHLALALTGRILKIGWVLACLAVLPAALLAHRFDLHNATWLQSSAQHRIIIWNFTAEQVLKAPLLGVGARSTYALGPRLEQTIKSAPGEVYRRTLSVHSHSVYLQTWFELGLVGAALLTLLGLSMLQAIRALPSPLQPYAYATFASAAAMAASSYGLWQIWFLGIFGSCAAYFGLASSLFLQSNREAVRHR
jgi:hypothetical protein